MGLTPLMCAAEANGGKVVKLLLEFKAEKDITDKKGWTALMYAACSGSLLSLEALLKQKVGTGIQSKVEGFTALHLACSRGHVKAVSLLLRWGANVNSLDRKQRTACHCVVDRSIDPDHKVTSDQDMIDTISVLSQYGCDMSELTSDTRESAKDMAIRHQLNRDVVLALEQAWRIYSRHQIKN
ncbi:ankyrin repeat domain-containing protein 16-like [Convolutriloba macropyga]|uniref:ankyrin repeat domain-containing protein 16-like n=1 Tax=Convolutriloba macropyga TaxID=536237 RepID=UPI003F52130C